MSDKQLSGILVMLVPQIIQEIIDNEKLSEEEATEALHTTGEKYIVSDIDLYIQARQTA